MKIYFEKITLFLLLFYILPRINKYKKKEIIYFYESKFFELINLILYFFNFKKFIKYNLISDKYLDKNNECLLSKIFRDDLYSFKKYLINVELFKKIKKTYNKNFYHYILKNSFFGYDNLSPPVTFLMINKVNLLEKNDLNKTLIIKKRNFDYFYYQYSSLRNINLISKFFYEFLDIKMLFSKFYSTPLLIIYNFLKNIYLNYKFSNKTYLNKDNSIFYVSFSSTGEFNLNKNFYNSETFFYNYSSLNKKFLIYKTIDKKNIYYLKNNKFNICKSYHNNFDLKKSLKKIKLKNYFLRNQLITYDIHKNYWSKYFERNKIKVYVDWNIYNNNNFIINDAINDYGGIFCLWEKSFQNIITPQTDCSSDFLFKYCSLLIDKKNHLDNQIIIDAGFLRDYGINYIKYLSKRIRNKMHKNGVKTIVSLFDQNSGDEYSNIIFNKNYELLIKKSLANPNLGLLIKPKKSETLLKRLSDENNANIIKLINLGRCYIFSSYGKYQSNIPVSAASYASDLCIHTSIKACSAAIESALTLTPTIILDNEGWPFNQLESVIPKNIIYRNHIEIMNIVDHFMLFNKVNDIGNWQSIIYKLDSYRDGFGAKRMGDFIKWIIGDYNNGLKKEKIIENSVNKFIEKWGVNKIIY